MQPALDGVWANRGLRAGALRFSGGAGGRMLFPLEAFWLHVASFGSSWGPLGPHFGLLGGSWDPPGALLGSILASLYPGILLGPSWAPFWPPGALLGSLLALGGSWEAPGALLGPIWVPFSKPPWAPLGPEAAQSSIFIDFKRPWRSIFMAFSTSRPCFLTPSLREQKYAWSMSGCRPYFDD